MKLSEMTIADLRNYLEIVVNKKINLGEHINKYSGEAPPKDINDHVNFFRLSLALQKEIDKRIEEIEL